MRPHLERPVSQHGKVPLGGSLVSILLLFRRMKTELTQRCFLRAFLCLALGCWSQWSGAAEEAISTPQGNRTIKIEYIAHACFRVTAPSGKRMLLDPYASRVWLGYDFPPNIEADAVLITHPHYDHDGGAAMRRKVPWAKDTPALRNPGTNQIADITVRGYAGKHADPWGKEFGQINTIWSVDVAGLRLVHLG